jgi:3-hydroxyisobutyrate dehydrogenase-like beta-hydroxyacid dehydrogenase
MMTTIGFVGLGKMGSRMAERLRLGGHPLVVYDVRPEACAPFIKSGFVVASSPADLANMAELVFVSLPSPHILLNVVSGPDGLSQGKAIKTYVDLSTTGAKAARSVSDELKIRNIEAVDAPVSGGVNGAAAGSLTIMVSGSRIGLERARPFLSLLGSRIFDLGETSGAGQMMKLVNQVVYFSTLALTMEAVVLAAKGGLDPSTAVEVLNASSGRSWSSENRFQQAVLSGKPAGALIGSACKDLRLALEEAAEGGVSVDIITEATRFWVNAANQLGPDEDIASALSSLENKAGVYLSRGL